MTSFRLTEQQLTKSIVSYDKQVTGKIRKKIKLVIVEKHESFKCGGCKKAIYEDTDEHEACVFFEDEWFCDECFEEKQDEEEIHICGKTGGCINGYSGCGEADYYDDMMMLGNTSFCINCGEKYMEKYMKEENEEDEEEKEEEEDEEEE